MGMILFIQGIIWSGMYHIGVVRALYETNLLPRVISGTSAGNFILGTN
jgi:predicted acylesterase/phospholipase RssA